jgi:hypothetical protein
MDFGGFADDFFEYEECDKTEIISQSNWTAHRSEPGVSYLLVHFHFYQRLKNGMVFMFCCRSGFTKFVKKLLRVMLHSTSSI